MRRRLQTYAMNSPTVLKVWHMFGRVNDRTIDTLLKRSIWVIGISFVLICFSIIISFTFPPLATAASYALLVSSVIAMLTMLAVITIVTIDTIQMEYLRWVRKQEDELMWIVNSIAVRSPDDSESQYPATKWARIPLPMERKKLLITAGIRYTDALTPATRKLTAEDLNVMAALRGVEPDNDPDLPPQSWWSPW